MIEIEENQGEQQQQRKHKIPVPTQYRQAAKILKQIVEEGKSFKELVFSNKHIVSCEELGWVVGM